LFKVSTEQLYQTPPCGNRQCGHQPTAQGENVHGQFQLTFK
jgi:hypothetical protein